MKKLNKSGAVLLMGVLVLSAVSLTIGLAVVLGGIGRTQSSGVTVEDSRARAMADACIDRALDELRDNPSSSGLIVVSEPNIQCSYTILSGANTIVQAESTQGRVTQRVQVDLSSVVPNIVISAWREVPEF